MTIEQLITHVDESIAKALRNESWLDAGVLSLGGFSTGVMRCLFSNLVHLPKDEPAYLECGLFKGGTFCAAMNNSPSLVLYGIEDYSQPFGEGGVREELEQNIAAYCAGSKFVHTFDKDCFEMDLSAIAHPIDVFFYDAVHSQDSQAKALPYFLPVMNDRFIFMVDDASWEPVSEGTRLGFEALVEKVRIDREWHLRGTQPNDDPIWHNGVSIYVCTKL